MSRLARWVPVWALAVGTSHKAARLAWQNRTLRHDLAVADADREALRAHFAQAVEQRDRARDVAAALCSEPAGADVDEDWPAWDEDGFERFLRTLGERPA